MWQCTTRKLSTCSSVFLQKYHFHINFRILYRSNRPQDPQQDLAKIYHLSEVCASLQNIWHARQHPLITKYEHNLNVSTGRFTNSHTINSDQWQWRQVQHQPEQYKYYIFHSKVKVDIISTLINHSITNQSHSMYTDSFIKTVKGGHIHYNASLFKSIYKENVFIRSFLCAKTWIQSDYEQPVDKLKDFFLLLLVLFLLN